MTIRTRISNTQHTNATAVALLILRWVIAVWIFSKGLPKVSMLFSGHVQFYSVWGMSSSLSLALTVFAQVFCSFLLMGGLFTRLAAMVLAINMLVAVIAVHLNDPFTKAEPALHFLLVFMVLAVAGGGWFPLDHHIKGRPSQV